MPKTEPPSAIEDQFNDETARALPGRRAPAIPEADFLDIQAAVDGLSRALENEAKSLDMMAVAEPFQMTLRSLAATCGAREGEPPDLEGLFARRFSSEEWVRECLARIEASPPGRLAWREIDADDALARARILDDERRKGRARGPLHGVPIGLKDMFDRRGRVSNWGSTLRENAGPAAQDSTVVARLMDAGAIILGTQHMAEFALSPTGLNAAYGPGRNPWSDHHVSGGSSSGAAMSVSAGHVPLAIGSDTGGSVRLPAALCGVSGLKPTQYRISSAGAMPLSPSLDCAGPIGSTVEACGWAFAVMAGADPGDLSCLELPAPGWSWMRKAATSLRVAVPQLSASALISQEMLDSFTEARRALVDAGVQCIEVPAPDLDLPGRLASILLAVESAAIHRQWLTAPEVAYGRQVRRRLSRGFLVPGMDYYDALRLRAPMLREFLRVSLPDADCLLLPAAPDIAPLVADTMHSDESALERDLARLSFWTRGINYLGLPALSVPAGAGAQGLPLAVQFVGRPLGEDAILALGRIFQKATHWHLRSPGS